VLFGSKPKAAVFLCLVCELIDKEESAGSSWSCLPHLKRDLWQWICLRCTFSTRIVAHPLPKDQTKNNLTVFESGSKYEPLMTKDGSFAPRTLGLEMNRLFSTPLFRLLTLVNVIGLLAPIGVLGTIPLKTLV